MQHKGTKRDWRLIGTSEQCVEESPEHRAIKRTRLAPFDQPETHDQVPVHNQVAASVPEHPHAASSSCCVGPLPVPSPRITVMAGPADLHACNEISCLQAPHPHMPGHLYAKANALLNQLHHERVERRGPYSLS